MCKGCEKGDFFISIKKGGVSPALSTRVSLQLREELLGV